MIPEYIRCNGPECPIQLDERDLHEWMFKQLLNHPYKQIFEPCFKFIMAYEYNRSITISDCCLSSDEMQYSDPENFRELKSMFDMVEYNYQVRRIDTTFEERLSTAAYRIALLYTEHKMSTN